MRNIMTNLRTNRSGVRQGGFTILEITIALAIMNGNKLLQLRFYLQ